MSNITVMKREQARLKGLGVEQQSTQDALDADEMEAALMVEDGRYRREQLDLNNEFMVRKSELRDAHLQRVRAITQEEA